MRQTWPGHQRAELPAELAAHPDDSAAYEDWKAWRQRRRNWFLEHGLTYDFILDLWLRRLCPGQRRHMDPNRARPVEVGLSEWPAKQCGRRVRSGCAARHLSNPDRAPWWGKSWAPILSEGPQPADGPR